MTCCTMAMAAADGWGDGSPPPLAPGVSVAGGWRVMLLLPSGSEVSRVASNSTHCVAHGVAVPAVAAYS